MNGNIGMLGLVAGNDLEDAALLDGGVVGVFQNGVQQRDGVGRGHRLFADQRDPALRLDLLDDDEAGHGRKLIEDGIDGGFFEVQNQPAAGLGGDAMAVVVIRRGGGLRGGGLRGGGAGEQQQDE